MASAEGMPVETLADALQKLLPPNVYCAGGGSRAEGPLFPEEISWLTGQTVKRTLEFGAGRRYARQAIAKLGFLERPILPGRTGYPVWPDQIVGSISHREGYAAAIVGRLSDFAALGVDIERRRVLNRSAMMHYLRPNEFDNFDEVAAIDRPTVLFSIKESAFKCLVPAGLRPVPLQDIHITSVPPDGFRAVIADAESTIEGRYGYFRAFAISFALIQKSSA